MGIVDRIFGGGYKCPNCGKSMKKSDVDFFEGENSRILMKKDVDISECDTYICRSCGTKALYKRQ